MDKDKSKSQLKREMHSLQHLGKRLTALKEPELKTLNLSEELLDALLLYHHIKSFEAKRRQIQFIGKLMRKMDISPIQKYFETIDEKSHLETQKFKEAEKWRKLLIENTESNLREFLNKYSLADEKVLKNLMIKAQTGSVLSQKIAYRKLFRLIRSIV